MHNEVDNQYRPTHRQNPLGLYQLDHEERRRNGIEQVQKEDRKNARQVQDFNVAEEGLLWRD